MRKNKTSTNKSRKNKANKARKVNKNSQKGKWGHIGAPPKPMKWPALPFIMARLFAMNSNVCELTVRKNVKNGLINSPKKTNPNGTIYELEPIPQKRGSVGRPKSRFVTKEAFDAKTMTLRVYNQKSVKVKTAPVVTVVSTPAPEPSVTVTNLAGPVVETVIESVPAPSAPMLPESPVVEAVLTETVAAPAIADVPVTAPTVEVIA